MADTTPQPTQTVSQLITLLTALLQEHGDISVWINDADTGWPLGIDTVEYYPGDDRGYHFRGISISGSYE